MKITKFKKLTYSNNIYIAIIIGVCIVLNSCQLAPEETVSLNIAITGAGSVVSYPSSLKRTKGSEVFLTAVPDEGYVFLRWSGGITLSSNPLTLSLVKDYSITANFVRESETIKYSLNATWQSYSKMDKLINTVPSIKSINAKFLSPFKQKDYLSLDTTKAIREKAILVKYKNSAESTAVKEVYQSVIRAGEKDFTVNSSVPFERIIISEENYTKIPDMISALRADSNVEYAEEDSICKAFSDPNDEYYSFQWNFSKLNMPSAWESTMGENDVIVAVIDTGAYFPLDDLGETIFAQGFDFVNYRVNPFDDNGHGSHVIGTIAQSTNNSTGVAGMAPNIKIMPIKVLAYDGYGYTSDIVQGIYYAVNNGAQIINMSLGSRSYSSLVNEACQYAHNHGVLVVAAAGNDTSSVLSYPAAYENVISVGAINNANQLAYYSNYGYGLDLVAPGGDLNSYIYNSKFGYSFPGGILQETFVGSSIDYYFFQGTSMAAPHVAGLAALLKSKNVTLSVDQIIDILKNSADDLGNSGYDNTYGYGLINPVKALSIPAYIVGDNITSTIVKSAGELEKWKITAAACTINATTSYDSSKGTLSLSIVNASGTVVATGIKVGNNITIKYDVPPTNKGDYYFVVKIQP
ncbi:MAG: S8 family serine peptidase [Mobilitalea sp.]